MAATSPYPTPDPAYCAAADPYYAAGVARFWAVVGAAATPEVIAAAEAAFGGYEKAAHRGVSGNGSLGDRVQGNGEIASAQAQLHPNASQE